LLRIREVRPSARPHLLRRLATSTDRARDHLRDLLVAQLRAATLLQFTVPDLREEHREHHRALTVTAPTRRVQFRTDPIPQGFAHLPRLTNRTTRARAGAGAADWPAGSTRRPRHRPAAQDVQMDVVHRLPAVRPGVHD